MGDRWRRGEERRGEERTNQRRWHMWEFEDLAPLKP